MTDKPNDKICVSNLSTAANHNKISHIFRKFGQLTKVYIQRQGATWNCGGQAYIAYADAESATKAVDEMNGEMFDESIMFVELVSDSEYLQQVKTMPTLTGKKVDGTIKPSRKQTKAPAKTPLTPKDIALAPNSDWEPYIYQTTTPYTPDEVKEPPSDNRHPPPPGSTPRSDSTFAQNDNSRSEDRRNRRRHAASSVGDARHKSKYDPRDDRGRSSHSESYKSAPNHPVPSTSWKGDLYDPPRKSATGNPLTQLSARGDERLLRRDPVDQDLPRSFRADRYSDRSRDARGDLELERLLRRDPVDQDLPRSFRADRYSDRSRDARGDLELQLHFRPARSDYQDDPHLESDRRRHDRYDAPRSRDYEYERFPATGQKEHLPSRHQDPELHPSALQRRGHADEFSEVQRARLYDDDHVRRDPYPRDSYPSDTRRDPDPREKERLYREPVRDGYREPGQLDERYSLPQRERAEVRTYGDHGYSNDQLHRELARAPTPEPRTLAIDRPTYDYSLATTLGADRPMYDYGL